MQMKGCRGSCHWGLYCLGFFAFGQILDHLSQSLWGDIPPSGSCLGYRVIEKADRTGRQKGQEEQKAIPGDEDVSLVVVDMAAEEMKVNDQNDSLG